MVLHPRLKQEISKASKDALKNVYTLWEPPKRLKPSEWAEQFRVIPPGMSAEPGKWRNARTPYLTGIMDAVCEAGVEEIIFIKPTQVGFSESLRNIIGYWVANDPGPVLVVMPDEKSATEAVKERIIPLLQTTPSLAPHLSSRAADTTQTVIKLDNCEIYVGWSGSPQSLASRPVRYVLFDEIDKYAPFSGDEADPISLGTERTNTYMHRARRIKGSTPTTRQGNIWRAWESCADKRRFHVPCPHCGKYQVLTFPQIKWPKAKDTTQENKITIADEIEQRQSAYYECKHCQGRIEDRHKPAMLLKGVWASESQTVTTDGDVTGGRPKSKRVGFHLNTLYSPWKTFSAIAAEFVRCYGDPGRTMNFRNSWLAEPYEEIVSKLTPSEIRDKSALSTAVGGIVPAWAVALIISVDTQKDHFWYVVRAWGTNWRSQLVRQERAGTFTELYNLFSTPFATDNGGQVLPQVMVIDTGGTGNRTQEVYDFAASDAARIIPIKGNSHKGHAGYTLGKQASGLPLYLLNTDYYKDRLQALIKDPDTTKWGVYRDVGENYCLQMASETQIVNRQTGKYEWVEINSGGQNHIWDCEVYSVAAYDIGRFALMPAVPIAPPPPSLPQQLQNTLQPVTSGNPWLGTKGSWL